MQVRNINFYKNCAKFSKASLALIAAKIKTGETKIPTVRKEKIEITGPGALRSVEVIEEELIFTILQCFGKIKELPAYFNCKKNMETNLAIKKHLNKLVGTLESKSIVTTEDSLRSLLVGQVAKNKNFEFIGKTFNKVYSEMEQFFYSKKLRFYVFAPLENFENKTKEIKLAKNLKIIKIDKERLESLWPSISFHGWHPLDIASIDFAIVTTLEAQKIIGEFIPPTEAIEKSEESKVRKDFNDVVLALTVFKEGLFGYNITIFDPLGWRPFLGRTMGGIPRKRFYFGPKYKLERNDAKKFKQFWKKFNTRNHKVMDLAVNRFRYGNERENIEDKIIDYFIAFESLLLGGEKMELSFRLALRTAVLLAKNRIERKKIFNEMRKGYSLRSDIVHGENAPRNEMQEITKNTERNLRQAIGAFLTLSKRRKHEEILKSLDNSIFYKRLQNT